MMDRRGNPIRRDQPLLARRLRRKQEEAGVLREWMISVTAALLFVYFALVVINSIRRVEPGYTGVCVMQTWDTRKPTFFAESGYHWCFGDYHTWRPGWHW